MFRLRANSARASLWLETLPKVQRICFITRLVFCTFAEDVELLPAKMFMRMLEASKAIFCGPRARTRARGRSATGASFSKCSSASPPATW